MQSAVAVTQRMVAATESDPIHFFQYLTVAIHHYYDAGNVANLRNPLAILAAALDRLRHHEQAATIAGFALRPFAPPGVPQLRRAITHLRDVLGDQTYESLARQGETMTTTAMATYAYDQIDQARAELEHPS
jgi:hypothetical protein